MKLVLNSQQKRLGLVVSALRENRLHVTSRGDDDVVSHVTARDVIGQVVVVGKDGSSPICALNFPVPSAEQGHVDTAGQEVCEEAIERLLRRKIKSFNEEMNEEEEDEGGKVEMRLTDVADMVNVDWQALATQLGMTDQHIDNILHSYNHPSEQVRSNVQIKRCHWN